MLPYFIWAFIFALTVLEAKFGRKKRGRWRRSSVEVVAGDTPAELRRVVERLVQRSATVN